MRQALSLIVALALSAASCSGNRRLVVTHRDQSGSPSSGSAGLVRTNTRLLSTPIAIGNPM